jgi:hypothetical protein
LIIDIFDWSSKAPGLRIKTHIGDLGSPSHAEAAIRPKERTAMILSQIEREMLRQKDRDHQWDDQIDVSYPSSNGRYVSMIYIALQNLYQPTHTPSVSSNTYHHPSQYRGRHRKRTRKKSRLPTPFACIALVVVVGS